MNNRKEYPYKEEDYAIFNSEYKGTHSLRYLDSYWLNKKELRTDWLSLKNKVFKEEFYWLPDKVFKEDFILRPCIMPGAVLIEEYYQPLMNCLKEIGEEEFVILEDIPTFDLRFKYPITLSWEEISLDEYYFDDLLIFELFQMVKNFYVFGKSGEWGKYVAGEHKDSIDIIGFKPKYLDLFRKHFPVTEEDKKYIEEALPEYKDQIVW